MPTTNLPVVVDAAADLALHPNRDNQSWYITAFVSTHEHRYGILVHHLCSGTPSQGVTASSVSVTGETRDFYSRNEVTLPVLGGVSKAEGIDIRTEIMTWTGNVDHMSVKAAIPDGEFDLSLRPGGRVLYNMGSGCFNMFADPAYLNFQYSFPQIEATGTLTLDGRTEQITGTAWLDRQWGALPQIGLEAGWTWMNFVMPNGDRISLWDTIYNSHNTWATVQSPDGTHIIVDCTLRREEERIWTSPTSGKRFATNWKVLIASLEAEFDVAVVVDRQELLLPTARYEGLARVTGVYKHHTIYAQCYVEAGAIA